MNLTLVILISILVVWMLASGWCGLARRYGGFVLVLLTGLALNWEIGRASCRERV